MKKETQRKDGKKREGRKFHLKTPKFNKRIEKKIKTIEKYNRQSARKASERPRFPQSLFDL